MNFYKNPSCGSRVAPGGPTDGATDRKHDKANSHFCNFANAPNKGGFVLPNTLQSMGEIIALAEENVLISNLFS
jgi:hypothetical protein